MAFLLIANTSAVGTVGTVTTAGIDTTGANLIVCGVAQQATTANTFTDSKGNVWNVTAETAIAAGVGVKLYYCYAPTVGTGHTFTVGSSSAPAVFVQAFSGALSAAAIDQQNGATSTGVATLQPGSVTPSQANELVVTVLGINVTGVPISIDSSYVMTNSQDFVGGNNYGGAMAYIIQTTATATNPTWTRTGTTGSQAARIATFKDSGAVVAAVQYVPQLMTLGVG